MSERVMATPLPPPGSSSTLYLVDLSSYLLRAYHAVVPLSSPSGEPTHAVHGLVNMLERLFRTREPALLAVAMDSGRETFRREIYPAYKATRPPAPPDLRIQMQRAEAIVRAWGLTVFKQEGVEADDLIASVCTWATEKGLSVVIVGADKDLMQLASPSVTLWDTMQNKVYGPAEVEEKFGVPPAMLGDLLALTGDTSDNIPGVPSVGPKTAQKLLHEHGSLEAVLQAAPTVSGNKLRAALVEHADNARLSRRLVELKKDCPLDMDNVDLKLFHGRERDLKKLISIYQELGFTRQLANLKEEPALAVSEGETPPVELGAAQPTADAPAAAHAQEPFTVTVVTELKALETELAAIVKEPFAFEVLTLSPSAHRGPVIGLAFTAESRSIYVPIGHRYLGAPAQLELKMAGERLGALDFSGAVVFDLKRQLVLAGDAELVLPGLELAHDALIAAYLIDPERRHSLESLAVEQEQSLDDFQALSREGKVRRDFDELMVDTASRYASARGKVTLGALRDQRARLKEFGLEHLFADLERPLSALLAKMERLGVLIDVEVLKTLGGDCDLELQRLEAKAIELAGKPFNVSSPRQLETILFDELKLKPLRRTKTARSTDAQTLEALSEEHPLPEVILEHRQIAKLKGTYIDTLPALVNPKTGRVHGAWEQAVAATGRISSTDPNLQNIPIRSALGRKIRAAFVAPPGYRLVSADYSQIELRVLAHMSQDPKLLEAFREGQDIHTRTAMEVFQVGEADVTREMRARSKAVNFGVIYGQGESGLAKALGIEQKVAAEFIAAYFERYQGVRAFLDETLRIAREGGAVQSLLGRRRILPDIGSSNRQKRLAAERIATNMPIQGSAADILKLAMLSLRSDITPGTRLVLTVHDELVFEVPEDEVPEAKRIIAERMSHAIELSVPLEVSVGDGPNWAMAH